MVVQPPEKSFVRTKIIGLLFLLFLMTVIAGCGQTTDCSHITDKMILELNAGNLTEASKLGEEVRRLCGGDKISVAKSDSVIQMADRISHEFSLNEEQVTDKLLKNMGTFSKNEKDSWEAKGWLECRLTDGKKMYFRRAASNLILLRKFHEQKDLWLKETAENPEMIFRLKHTEEAYKLSDKKHDPVLPVNFGITYTITVKPDAVPDGETIRCWMPYPKANQIRQGNIELLGTSSREYIISPDTAIHSTIYMETKAQKGVPAVFRISYRYRSSAQYFNLPSISILPYDRESDIFKKYTSEQLPQISFGKEVRQLADSITGAEENPAEIVRKIYMWFKENIPWAGALEYSVMPDIPGYVIRNRRGDCGMQTFLYMDTGEVAKRMDAASQCRKPS
jgi:hypothetical protein